MLKNIFQKKIWTKYVIPGCMIFVITFLLIFLNAFYTLDKQVADWLCQTGRVPDKRIYILAIDDKSLERYGKMGLWSREIYTELLKVLNQDGQTSPAVICFDVMYIENTDPEVDADFAEACRRGGNVVTAMNLQFKEIPVADGKGKVYFDKFHVDQADYPYPELKSSAAYGFANTVVDKDGVVRRARTGAEYEEEQLYSLAVRTYQKYMEKTGGQAVLPDVDENNQFVFAYAGGNGSYSVIPFCDVADGTVPATLFKDQIVFVGAYAVGLYDAYIPAISHGSQMFGVEIQANITDALLNHAVQKEADRLICGLAAAAIVALYYIVSRKLRGIFSVAFMGILAGTSLVMAKAFYRNGTVVPVLIFPVMLVFVYIVTMVWNYMEEIQRRRLILDVFRKYVAPQVVDEIGKKGGFQVALGGERRHIAVLFVDIRGFTAMAESLPPEEVVDMLNEYLELTSSSIFRNSGTLDKFVGDATMAVFNAPFELDDYVYKAVKTAWEMKQGAAELEDKFEEQFHRNVSFGIGVNCGEAIMGNIGCDFRMDYTAIGDTVNTAARLESSAKAGQILITDEVYREVRDRVEVTPMGEIALKGKEKTVIVYQLDGVRE